jgi:hypothetical protein
MLQEATMVLAGWLLIVAGLLFMVVQAIWPGTFMGTSRSFEGGGFRFSTNWPGFELIAFGAILLVIDAAQGRTQAAIKRGEVHLKISRKHSRLECFIDDCRHWPYPKAIHEARIIRDVQNASDGKSLKRIRAVFPLRNNAP